MRSSILVLALASILGPSQQFTPRRRGSYKGSGSQARIKELCKDRVFNEFFREQTDNCAKVVKCDTSRTGLSTLTCSPPLVFDVDTQICNYEDIVNNCDREQRIPECTDELRDNSKCRQTVESESLDLPIEKDEDLLPECDRERCFLPGCFCSADGTLAPGVDSEGGMTISEVPQMIMISFNGAVTDQNMDMYEKLFKSDRVNPNGCSVKGTFFVSHKYTNYSAVTELNRKGHEVGVFSVSSSDEPDYWANADYDTWLLEMAGDRQIIEKFAGITPDEPVLGVRAPYLRVGGDTQFKMMNDTYFIYDASIPVPLSRVPVWPYTLDYRIPHKCFGNCPKQSWPIWEIPINELDRREDPKFDEELTGCPLVSSCTNIQDTDQFKTLLEHNFQRHYTTNRAPLSLSFAPFWLKSNKGFVKVFEDWMDQTLARYNNVYFVTNYQSLLWITNPTRNQNIPTFEDWKKNCKVEGQPVCSLPNECPLTSPELPNQETIRLWTCQQCPRRYPWLLDPEGAGS